MSEKPYNDIDDLLVGWSEQHEPSQAHFTELGDKIADALAEQSTQRDSDQADSKVKAATAIAVSWRVLSWVTAAVVLIAIGASVWFTRPHDEGVQPNRLPPDRVAIVEQGPIEVFTAVQKNQKRHLMVELDRLFGGKRVWVAETESDVVLGGDIDLASTGNSTEPNARDSSRAGTVAMRLVLAKREVIDGAWQRVWSVDVVSRTDQLVQFVSQEPSQANANFTAWAHVLPDGLVACDVDLHWTDGQSSRLSDSLLLVPEAAEMGSPLNVDGIEYRLFHVVSVLDKATT